MLANESLPLVDCHVNYDWTCSHSTVTCRNMITSQHVMGGIHYHHNSPEAFVKHLWLRSLGCDGRGVHVNREHCSSVLGTLADMRACGSDGAERCHSALDQWQWKVTGPSACITPELLLLRKVNLSAVKTGFRAWTTNPWARFDALHQNVCQPVFQLHDLQHQIWPCCLPDCLSGGRG